MIAATAATTMQPRASLGPRRRNHSAREWPNQPRHDIPLAATDRIPPIQQCCDEREEDRLVKEYTTTPPRSATDRSANGSRQTSVRSGRSRPRSPGSR